MMHETTSDGMAALLKRHEDERAEMQAQLDLAAELTPMGIPAPARVMFPRALCPWLTYAPRTRADAAFLLDAWMPYIVGVSAVEDRGTVTVAPDAAERLPKGNIRWSLVGGTVVLAFTSGEGYDGAEVQWFARVAGKLVSIHCRLEHKNGYSHTTDWPHPRPSAYTEGEGWNCRVVKSYPGLSEDRVIKWSSSDRNIHATYYYATEGAIEALYSMLGTEGR